MRWYLAYGSNMCAARLEARVGSTERRGHAWLVGFSLRFHKRGRDGSGKCDAFATGEPDDVLHGALFGLTAPQAEALHRHEGPDYAIETMAVGTAHGEVDAFVYVAHAHAVDHALVPFDWYHAFVLHGAREAGLPDAYVRRIAGVAVRRDPDGARARSNHRILRRSGL